MSDVIIRAIDLCKTYRLYSSPYLRFLDMFGLLRKKEGAYTEHRAIDSVNLVIRRGERVAFIGRNGAGKSTLLKLATKVIEPTSGTIEVAEGANALLQIGAGFHPDFTGRENAYSYLAHLGIAGKAAKDKVAELIEFAELEEYVDQPIKTYSTGMVARLMFATSTTINPKLLVLDEILGVGDAYFSQKSYERIESLCREDETTVLIVSHDIYAASRLCARMIWIDHGRIMADGDSPMVMNMYENSIRVQEESRLRKRKLAKLNAASTTETHNNKHHLIIEIRSVGNVPAQCPVYFSQIALTHGEQLIELPLAQETGGPEEAAHLILTEGCWGSPSTLDAKTVRPMLDYGSSFHKVAGVFSIDDHILNSPLPISIQLSFRSDKPCTLAALAILDGREIYSEALPASSGSWIDHSIDISSTLEKNLINAEHDFGAVGKNGSGAISIDDVRIINNSGIESYRLLHAQPISILIDYRIRNPTVKEHAQVLLAFHRDGIIDVCRVITRELLFDAKQRSVGTIRMSIPSLWLGNGSYSISIMVAREGYYDQQPTQYYSINPDVYTCLSRAIDIEVTGGGSVGSGTGIVNIAEWALEPRTEIFDTPSRDRHD